MIVMGVGQDDVGNIIRRNADRLELALQRLANAKGADIDQDVVPIGAAQRGGAPPDPAMAHGLARKSLHQDVNSIHVAVCFRHSTRIFAASAMPPNFSLSDRTK